MPVVVGLYYGKRDFAVRNTLEALACESRKCRKAQGAEHPIDVHVIDPSFYVPRAPAHVLVGQRFHAVFLLGPSHDGIQSHVACGSVLEYPDVATLTLLYDGFAALKTSRHVTRKGVWRLDYVIVHTNENQIIELHQISNGLAGDAITLRPGVTLICRAV